MILVPNLQCHHLHQATMETRLQLSHFFDASAHPYCKPTHFIHTPDGTKRHDCYHQQKIRALDLQHLRLTRFPLSQRSPPSLVQIDQVVCIEDNHEGLPCTSLPHLIRKISPFQYGSKSYMNHLSWLLVCFVDSHVGSPQGWLM